MTIPVGRLAPNGQWDQQLLDDLFDNRLFPTGLEFRRVEGYPNTGDGCALICPGRYWAGHEAEISAAVAKYSWLLLIVTSDEEATFDCSNVLHDNARFWIQTPREGKQYPEARFIGVGYTPHMRNLPKDPPDKGLDVFISAQRTHIRRVEAFEALKHQPNSKVEATAGFTHGMPPGEYAREMCGTKVAPCPSGAVSPDSFRFWEALEAHAIPVADTVSPVDGVTEYWRRLFGYDTPFPILRDCKHLPEIVDGLVEGWPANANRVAAWWCRYKRSLALGLREELQALGAL